MIKWLISLMMACSQTLTLSACNPDDSPKKTENIVPELKPESNPVPSPEPTSDNGMFDLSEGENGNPPTLLLSSGYEMPIIGLGTYSLHDDVCMNAILAAVKLGYRKFDTASYYGKKKRSAKPFELAACCGKNCLSARNSIRISLPMQKKPLRNHCVNSI